MTDLASRIAALPPEKRRLLELRMAREGLAGKRSRAIPKRQGGGPYPLSFGQQRLWFVDQLNPDTAAYNIPFAGRLAGALDAGLLAAAVEEMGRRHEVLRTRFVKLDGSPAQVIDPEPALAVPLIDLSALPAAVREAAAERLAAAEPQRLFDLARGPVLRVSLLRLAAADHWLVVTMPHIVTDAWSMALFFRELPLLYEAFRRGEPSPLPPLEVQVADHAVWQRGAQQAAVLAGQLAFWRRQLAGAPTVLELPTDHPRPPLQSFRGRRYPLAVPAAVARRLATLAEGRGATTFMAYLAALYVLLYRYTGQEDLLVGSPVVTREETETHALIGFFINTAVLRGDLSGRPTFAELLDRVRDMTLATLAHQEVPFERLVEELGLPRDLSRPPLAQVQVVLQNVHIPEPEFEDLSLLKSQQTETRTSRFDLSLGLWEEDEDAAPQGGLEYSTDLFDRTTMQRLAGHFLRLLEAIVADPGRHVDELPMLSSAQRHQLLAEGNDTAAAYPRDETLDRLFAAVAAASPDAVALATGGGDAQMSYGALAAASGRLAHRLAAAGVGTDTPVGLYLEASLELVVGVLGVLAAGGAYLPLDPAYPDARLAAMVAEARPPVLLAAGGVVPPWCAGPGAPAVLDPGALDAGAAGAAHSLATPESLAYVVYTSGSTGRPKGVAVPHRGVARLVCGATYARFAADEVFLQIAPISFDAATFEIWGSLLAGARLVLYPERRPTLARLEATLERHRVSTLSLTVGLFRLVTEERPAALGGLVRLLTGGEVVPPAAARRFVEAQPHVHLADLYGPTESTTFTTCQPLDAPPAADRPIPVGRPIANTRVFVAGRHGSPLPPGVWGELQIGGDGLARGYLAQPAATASAFVPDALSGDAGARLYLSGDRARWRPDGRIELSGRGDDQVKLRGFRVEPNEVAAALAAHPEVAQAVVLARPLAGPDGGTAAGAPLALVAYVVPAGGAPDGDDAWMTTLRDHLAARLPDYMLPAAFVVLPALPLTANGKVDRAALPAPERPAADAVPAAPSTPAEEALAAIWGQVLGLPEVGVDADFFALGGDSIRSIQVVSRAAEAGLHLEPRHLFEHPTIAALARVAAVAPRVEAEQGPLVGPLPLTPAQHGFFALDLATPGHWNMSLELTCREPLDAGALAAALAALIDHHDALRSRFEPPRGDGPWQATLAPPGGAAPLAAVDLGRLTAEDRERVTGRLTRRAQRSLDLAAGPLLRALYLEPGEGAAASLLLVVHHLVVDAVSWRILLEDLAAAYARRRRGQGAALPAKTTSVRRWAERLARWASTPEARAALAYWRGAGGEPAAVLADDDPAGSRQEGDAARVEGVLDAATTRALLTEAGAAYGSRPEELVLAALALVWQRRLGGALWVDREGHGREAPFDGVDLARTVGWLTSIAPLRLDLSAAAEPGAALKAVKEALRGLPLRGLAFGVLRWLGDGAVRRELARLPRPQVAFNYLGAVDLPDAPPFTLAPQPPGPLRDPRGERPHALEIDAWVTGGQLHLAWTYSPRLHRTSTVVPLAEAHRAAVGELVEHCRSAETRAFTPSDFPQAGLDQGQLDRLISRIGGGGTG